jgi:hypothetical protein
VTSPPGAQPARSCPQCGNRLPAPHAGRRPVYCGKACRQKAYWARTADDRAAKQARQLRAKLATADETLSAALGALAHARGQMTLAVKDAGEDQDVMLVTGHRWESSLNAAAQEVQHAAGRIADLTRLHDHAATRYRDARARSARTGGSQPPDGRGKGQREEAHNGHDGHDGAVC